MPYRLLAANALGEFMSAIAHLRRVQIIEELRSGKIDVASLTKMLGVSHLNVSQQLPVLRAHRVVAERREGRRVFYRLRAVEVAEWLVREMDFLAPMDLQTGEVREAIKNAKPKWSDQCERTDLELEDISNKRFMTILFGVDLSWCDRFVSDDLSAANAEAVRQSLRLAKLNSASVEFFYFLDLSAKAQQLVSESNIDESTVLGEAKTRLAEPVAKARAEGVVVGSHLVAGKSWLELIRLVLRNDHDLVLVGTHHMRAIKGFFLGSTGIKLLRKCPSAVWINQSVLRPRPCQGVGALRRHGV